MTCSKTSARTTNTAGSNMAGYRYVSREFSRIEAISAGTHGLSAAKVHNCGGFVGPESSGVGRHYGSTACSSSSLSSRSATVV